jgi:hypothetical protein
MGHPFVWLGVGFRWVAPSETQGPSTLLGMTDSFRGRASGLHGVPQRLEAALLKPKRHG